MLCKTPATVSKLFSTDQEFGLELVDARRREFAYREYGKAISCPRGTIAEKKLSIRTSLITSLLFACFEAYHGNSDAAAAQVYAGIEVMELYSKKRKIESSKLDKTTPPPIDVDIVDMFSLLEIQATSWATNEAALFTCNECETAKKQLGKFPESSKIFDRLRAASS
ncbi:hypothetical protein IFR05_017356 [Cadophora sp. M221]|nr:hypothetical protein IFR05_017356 [Cadophora sp. M221]